MANWDTINSEGTVIDRRATNPGLAVGGGSMIVGIIIFFALQYFGVNVDPSLINDVVNQTNTSSQVSSGDTSADGQAYVTFASRVLGSTNDFWTTTLASQKRITYNPPSLLLYRSGTQSGCGYATSAVGPFYCPEDSMIYLDETFFDTLKQLGGSNSDVSQAYVIAHEVGHNVQDVLGTMTQVTNSGSYGRTGDGSLSVRMELQADCYAGMWARSVKNQGIIEQSETQAAIQSAKAVGDDNIQERTGDMVNPESWTHGSSAERVNAFNNGFTGNGSLSACGL